MADPPRRRAADAAVDKHGGTAITGLENLIEDAVRRNDDARVAELDSVLKAIEGIIEVPQGTPVQRADKPSDAIKRRTDKT